MQPEERFNRIEATLERVSDRLERITESPQELEAAQLNQQRAHIKLAESLASFVDETKERITNLTILVDRLVERDLGRSS